MARLSDFLLVDGRDELLRERSAVRNSGPLGTVKLELEQRDRREFTLARLMSDPEPTERRDALDRAGDTEDNRLELDLDRRDVLRFGSTGRVKALL